MPLAEAIRRTVFENPGINGVELVLKVIDVLGHTFTFRDYSNTIDMLLEIKQIREEEYTRPEMPERIKSRYYSV